MGLFSPTVTPSQDRLNRLKAEFESLRADANERIERQKQYRAEIDSSRSRDLETAIAGGTDYGHKKRGGDSDAHRHNIPLAFGKALVVKHSYRMAGQLPEIVVDERAPNPQERYRASMMQKIAWSFMRASSAETTLASGAWDASESGAAVFDVYFDIGKNTPIFRRLDPAGVVVLEGVDNPHDFQRVYRSWLVPLSSVQSKYAASEYEGELAKVNEITAYQNIAGTPMVMMVEVCDPVSRSTFCYGKNSVVGLKSYDHNYGFTPVVVIPNLGPYDCIFGWADYEFVRSLQFYMAQLFSQEADILRTVANGSYIEKGTGQNPNSIKQTLRKGGVIPSKREGSIEPIQPPTMPGFAEVHAERAMEFFKMLGFAPDASWGNGAAGRSGTAAAAEMAPAVEYAAMKQLNWATGLSRLFSYCFRIMEQKASGTVYVRGAIPSRVKGKQDKFSFPLQVGGAPFKTPAPGALDPTADPTDIIQTIDLPQDPKELFDGEYEARFIFNPSVDPHDPVYVASEMSKFAAGAQSLQTTLENVGVESPEDEMRRIEAEADRFPWINQGMVKLILAQLGNQQGQGGGNPDQQAPDYSGAISTMSGPGGGAPALGADAMQSLLPGDASAGPLYGNA